MGEWVQLGATLRAVTAAINIANTARPAARAWLRSQSVTVHTLSSYFSAPFPNFILSPYTSKNV